MLLNVVQTKSQDLMCNPREERRGRGGGGNREEAGLTNAHSRGEDANADQGDKGCDNLQMERMNQILGEEREEHQETSGQGKANPQVVNGSTEQELLGSEAQVSAQDGRLEDGSDMGREEVRPNSRATSMDVDHDVNWEDTGLTNAHGRGEDASADQGDKGCDYLQMERVNQISGEERGFSILRKCKNQN